MATDAPSGSPDQSTNEPVHVEGETHLEQLVADHDVVLVDFYADWCGPCKMLSPVLDQLAAQTDALVAKVDVDDHQLLAGEFGVRGVPTLVLFADGQQVEQHTGVLPAERLQSMIEGYTE
ncbi:thioredoxin [Natrarchaeobaculum sulfurireducens]|uniref:Thiol-disulfide isomerase n=1 Tax=Natrarchaeobaculum sulfurireducens TaxID=2044521 RepID=A0A346PSZ4_9EURY|nr:thioredoxin [Natrarchaeobaculum sulfurireducens]AXR77396.1 Thiol-disulfide isomerase [Natrarchaeobaculum sulfurireducens]AXR82639.1 Thioredoxin [Natrarchaeobaculum sulfurireducens]